MLMDRINDEIKDMSYEKQKEVLAMIRDMDRQPSCNYYEESDNDDNNIVAVVIDAFAEAIMAAGRLIFKK